MLKSDLSQDCDATDRITVQVPEITSSHFDRIRVSPPEIIGRVEEKLVDTLLEFVS